MSAAGRTQDVEGRDELVVATGNPGKLREIERMLDGLDVRVVPLAAVGLDSPVEDGDTFEQNALLKARAAAAGSGRLALADDSGLEVDALGGDPGVRSARFAGPDANDRANNDKLLRELDGVTRRTARFVSVVALVAPDGREWTTRGTMEGRILAAPEGQEGFGYDPLFQADGQDVSNGRLSPLDKDRLSHRGAALRAILPVLSELLGGQPSSNAR